MESFITMSPGSNLLVFVTYHHRLLIVHDDVLHLFSGEVRVFLPLPTHLPIYLTNIHDTYIQSCMMVMSLIPVQ